MKAFRLPENFSDWAQLLSPEPVCYLAGRRVYWQIQAWRRALVAEVALRNFLPAFFFTVRFICLPALKAICFFAFAPQFWLFAFPDITIKNASARKDFLLSARAP